MEAYLLYTAMYVSCLLKTFYLYSIFQTIKHFKQLPILVVLCKATAINETCIR